MSAVAELALVFVAACGLGVGLTFGRFHWSRDEVIARRRRRALRRHERAGARAEAHRQLDRERAARAARRRGSPVDTGLGAGWPPDMPRRGSSGGSGQASAR